MKTGLASICESRGGDRCYQAVQGLCALMTSQKTASGTKTVPKMASSRGKLLQADRAIKADASAMRIILFPILLPLLLVLLDSYQSPGADSFCTGA